MTIEFQSLIDTDSIRGARGESQQRLANEATSDALEQLNVAVRSVIGRSNEIENTIAADGTLLIPDGSVTEPGLAFLNETKTGIFRDSIDSWGISNEGVEWVMFQHTGSNYSAAVDINAVYSNTSLVGYGALVDITGDLTVDGASDVSAYGLSVAPSLTTGDGGGPGIDAASAIFRIPDITEGTNPIQAAAAVIIEGAPTEGEDNYALLIEAGSIGLGDGNATIEYTGGNLVINPQVVGSGNLRVDGPLHVNDVGPHAIGTSPGGFAQLRMGGTFTSNGSSVVTEGLRWESDLVMAAGDTLRASHWQIGSSGATITTQGNSETITNISTMHLGDPVITVGTGDTITNAQTLYVESAPTEATNNYAIRVNTGLTSVDDLEVRGSLTGAGAAITGMIVMWGAAAAPTGWLLCDGSAVSRTTYADLFAVIGTTYGNGNGSTTFNVPDLRQRFPMGKAASGTGSTLGGAGGAIDHTHGAGSYAAASHSHGDGTLTVASHTHGVGTLADDGHLHGPGTYTMGGHTHGISFTTTAVQSGSGVTVVDDITSPSDSGGAGESLGFGSSDTSNADLSGSTAAASPDVTGSTGSTAPSVSGTSGTANPPFQTFNFVIKT